MEDDLNLLSENIIKNLDQINSILVGGKLESQLSCDLPDRFSQLVQSEWIPSSDANTVEPSNRLSVEDVDQLFDKIHRRHTTGSRHKNVSHKKAIPLQQSRILNETNLVNSPSGSLTDLSDIAKLKSIDVDGLVRSLKQSAEMLSKIDSQCIEPIHVDRIQRIYRRNCARIRDCIQDIDTMIQDFERYVTSEQKNDENKGLFTENLVAKLGDLSETMSQVIFIKSNEYIPDLDTSNSLDDFPLAECLDSVIENIQQKKL